MSEPKAFASLSAGLLARKGMARPAMRRQGAAGLGMSMTNAPAMTQDDLGWNDMGFDAGADAVPAGPAMDLKQLLAGSVMAADHADGDDHSNHAAAPIPEVRRQQADLVQRMNLESELNNDHKGQENKREKIKSEVAGKQARKPKAGVMARQRGGEKNVGKGHGEAIAAAVDSVRARNKAAFTLRLDAERHLRLRLVSAVRNQSSQAILTQLLDEFLASTPEIGDLAGRVSAAPPARLAVPRP